MTSKKSKDAEAFHSASSTLKSSNCTFLLFVQKKSPDGNLLVSHGTNDKIPPIALFVFHQINEDLHIANIYLQWILASLKHIHGIDEDSIVQACRMHLKTLDKTPADTIISLVNPVTLSADGCEHEIHKPNLKPADSKQ